MELHTLLHSIKTILDNRRESAAFAELCDGCAPSLMLTPRNMGTVFNGGVLYYDPPADMIADENELADKIGIFFSAEWVLMLRVTNRTRPLYHIGFWYKSRPMDAIELLVDTDTPNRLRSHVQLIADRFLLLLTDH